MRRGHRVLLHHSNAQPSGAAGIARTLGEGDPDPTRFDPASEYHDTNSTHDAPRWDLFTLAQKRHLRFVLVAELREPPKFVGCPLHRRAVMPLTDGARRAIEGCGISVRPQLEGADW